MILMSVWLIVAGRTVGVLSVQGAFQKHIQSFQRCSEGLNVIEVRNPSDLKNCDSFVIPGGESTVISKLIRLNGLDETIANFINSGKPVWGTCAGMILLSNHFEGGSDVCSFSAIDIDVVRNGYGSQKFSFEIELPIPILGEAPFNAIFIRAPIVNRLGNNIEVLASDADVPVLCKENNILVSSFHPELTQDTRLHKYFLEIF